MHINHADIPGFHNDVKNFNTFEKAYSEIKKIVADSVTLINNPSFAAKRKFKVEKTDFEGVYETFERSEWKWRSLALEKHRYPLDRKCIQNLFRLLWDEWLVTFFTLWISAGVISLAESSWTQVFIELEAKFLWINQMAMAKLIHEFWGVERYKALLTDDYFSFVSGQEHDALENDGKRQIRIREKDKRWQSASSVLTLKRKPSTHSKEYTHLIWKYAASMDEEIDIQKFKKKMKALLEQEFDIHDNIGFRSFLTAWGLHMSRSKIKLRRSCEFKWGKVESEDIHWVPEIVPFAELEAPSEEILNMMIDYLQLSDKTPLITWSQWVFQKYGVSWNYITYSQDSARDNNVAMQMRNHAKTKWLDALNSGYFDPYDVFT